MLRDNPSEMSKIKSPVSMASFRKSLIMVD